MAFSKLKSKILIVSFVMPPTPGIGGRRWAKFSKYLYRNVADVEILTVENYLSEVSLWNDDVSQLENRIDRVKSGYPSILGGSPQTILDRIKYRLSLVLAKFKTKGNYYDRSIFLPSSFYKSAEQKIENGCNIVVVTVGPFNYSYGILKLKKKYPKTKFIVDYRDPWTDNETSFGFESLTPARLSDEVAKEEYVVKNADGIIAVSQEMLEKVGSRFKIPMSKMFHLPNGFDTDDFPKDNVFAANDNSRNKLDFVFIGTFYLKCEDLFSELKQAIEELNEEVEGFSSSVNFNFYGDSPAFIQSSKGKYSNLSVNGKIPLQEVYSVLNDSDISMLFLTRDLGFSRSTKFYEYLAMKNSIAVFSDNGETGKFVVENEIGYDLNLGQIKSGLQDIYNEWLSSGSIKFNSQFSVHEFSVEQRTNELINYLAKL